MPPALGGRYGGEWGAGGRSMEYVRQLVFKYVLIGAATVLVLPAVHPVGWGQALWIAAVATVALYLIGDVIVLPFAGNALTVVVDFLLAFAVFLAGPFLAPTAQVGLEGALTGAAAVAIIEVLYHQYVLQRGPSGAVRG